MGENTFLPVAHTAALSACRRRARRHAVHVIEREPAISSRSGFEGAGFPGLSDHRKNAYGRVFFPGKL
jgi:hypothetical protein